MKSTFSHFELTFFILVKPIFHHGDTSRREGSPSGLGTGRLPASVVEQKPSSREREGPELRPRGRRALVPCTAGRGSCWLPEEAPSARPATPGPRSSVSESRQRAGRRAAGLRAACLSSWARDVPRASALTAAHIRGGWGRRCVQAAAPGSGLTWAARGERPAAGRSLCLLSSLRTLRTRPGSQRAGR